MDYSLPGSSGKNTGDSPGKNTGVGCFSYKEDKVGYALGHDDEEWSSFIICKVGKCLLHGFRGKKVMR